MRTFYVQKCAQTYMIIDWKTFLGQDLDPDISHTCITSPWRHLGAGPESMHFTVKLHINLLKHRFEHILGAEPEYRHPFKASTGRQFFGQDLEDMFASVVL